VGIIEKLHRKIFPKDYAPPTIGSEMLWFSTKMGMNHFFHNRIKYGEWEVHLNNNKVSIEEMKGYVLQDGDLLKIKLTVGNGVNYTFEYCFKNTDY